MIIMMYKCNLAFSFNAILVIVSILINSLDFLHFHFPNQQLPPRCQLLESSPSGIVFERVFSLCVASCTWHHKPLRLGLSSVVFDTSFDT